jgi:O-antigen/teichoic acid export membrane protein
MMTIRQSAAATAAWEGEFRQETRDHERIAFGGSMLLLASAFGNGLNYVFGVFLARMLGAEEFGLYALALTVFNMLTLTVVFGLDVGTVKFVSQHLANGQRARAGDTIVAAGILAFGSGVAAATVLASLAHPFAVALYDRPELARLLIVFSAAIPLATLTNVLLAALQACQTIRSTIFIKYLCEPVGKFALAAALLAAGFHLLGVLVSLLLVFAISAVLSIHAVYRIAFKDSSLPFRWNGWEAGSLVAYCLPLVISNMFGVVAPRSDILILGYWASPQEVGIYLAAFQTAAIISLVLGAFVTGSAPIIGRASSEQGQSRLKDSYQSVSRLSITVSLPIFCCLIMFGREILGMFGAEFPAGTTALVMLAVGQLFNNATGSANTVLLMGGHSRLVMINTFVMGLLLLSSTAAMIPHWGMTGAALAASITFVLTNVIRVMQVWRLHQVQPYTYELLKPMAAASVAAALVLCAQSYSMITSVPVLCFVFGLMYVSGLVACGINQQDRLVLRSLVSRFIVVFGKL